jgi:TRAP-type transport system periplasmic protein
VVELPPELQQILRAAVNKHALTDRSETEIRNGSLADELVRLGMKINSVDTVPFRARLRGCYADERADFGNEAWTLREKSVGALG